MKSSKAGSKSKLATKQEQPAAVAVEPVAEAPLNISISLHPIASFQFLVDSMEKAPAPQSEWKWSWSNTLYYVRITSVQATPERQFAVLGGIYVCFQPGIEDYPEATFLRGVFAGARLAGPGKSA